MSQEEKRDLQKSIKELPRGNLKRVAEIIRDHYVASGKEFSDEVTVNLEEEVSHHKNMRQTSWSNHMIITKLGKHVFLRIT